MEKLQSDWGFWLREHQQLPPRDTAFDVWLCLAGRGWGKTLTGAHATQLIAESGAVERIHLVGADAGDVRDVMVEGPTGIMATAPKEFRPTYEPSKRRLTWGNGVVAVCYGGGMDPEALRGPQCGWAWVDELMKFRHQRECWDQLMLGLRLGDDPWAMVTTTPKPTKLLRELMADPHTLLTQGNTYQNIANLPRIFRERIIRLYEGTSLGAQELWAKVLNEARGALWKLAWLSKSRVAKKDAPALGDLVRIVVAVDPAGTAYDDAEPDELAETGIIVVGLTRSGFGVVLDDLSGVYSPGAWADAVRTAYWRWQADVIVAERNFGGDMVEHTIRQAQYQGEHLPVKVITASRGKAIRAQPIAMLWQQGRCGMVGHFATLEDQLRTWEPGEKSPDRLDALVWGMTELFYPSGSDVDLGALPFAA